MAPPRRRSRPTDRRPPPALRSVLGHRLNDQLPSIERSGSATKIAKESLNFFTLEPVVLGGFLRLRFLR